MMSSGVGGLQGAQLGDEGGRPVASVGGEADEDGVTLSDLSCEGAHLSLLVTQVDLGEGDDLHGGCRHRRVGMGLTLTSTCHGDGAQSCLLQERRVGGIGVEGIVGRGDSGEGAVIAGWSMEKYVPPR